MLRERNARLFAFPFARLFPPLKPFQPRAYFLSLSLSLSLSFSLCFSSMSAARGHTSFLFPWNPISEFLLEKKKSNNNNSTLHLDCFFW